MKTEIYQQCGRAYGKSEAIRIADKLLGLRVEEIIVKLAEAVMDGEDPRIVHCIKMAAVQRFEESLKCAENGRIKL